MIKASRWLPAASLIVAATFLLNGCAGTSTQSQEASAQAANPTPVKALITVYYGTNRKYLGQQYADTSSERVDYGTVQVSIPVSHQRGHIESPNYVRYEFIEDPGKHFYVLKPVPLDKQDFFSRMNNDLDANQRQILLFVHGFNVPFNEAAKRTAQLAYDLNFQGIPAMYSWPSRGSVLSYSSDRDAGEASAAYLKTFIKSLALESKVTNLTIIAHSMGTYALSEAILRISADPEVRDKIRIKNIILASPDIDQELFTNTLEPAVEAVGDHCAIYVSDHDMALGFSSWIYHDGRPRVGRNLFAPDQFELIDASELQDGILDHSAYGDCGPALTDISGFIQGEPPNTRPNLVEVDQPCKHWRIAGP